MRIFEHVNEGSTRKCPICNTLEDKPCILVGLDGTEKNGNMEAEIVHVDCLELTIRENFDGKKDSIIYIEVKKYSLKKF